jgi:hypothetical protein
MAGFDQAHEPVRERFSGVAVDPTFDLDDGDLARLVLGNFHRAAPLGRPFVISPRYYRTLEYPI